VRLSAWLLALVAVGAASCGGSGGGSKQDVPEKPPPTLATRCGPEGQNVKAQLVWFRASDGVLLDGAMVGDGDVAVVLAHQYPSNLCPWLPYAKTLASHGYRAFAFDFRGLGASDSAKAYADAGRYELDVEAAAAEVRRLGAKEVFLAGASAGGTAVLAAGASVSPEPAGIISFSGETYFSDNLDALKTAPKLSAPLLLLVARHDRYVTVGDYRKLERKAASEDKRLAAYSGAWHGYDLLYSAPYKSQVNQLVLDFLSEHSDGGD
jgi:alpha-beta hydrolase superfamily lysophospholipase